jgi:hypothetical protein
MPNKVFMNGMLCLGAGLLASSISSFLGHFPVFGASTGFTQGFFDGLSVIAYGAAVLILIRSRKVTYVEIEPQGQAVAELPILVLLGWYLMVLHQLDPPFMALPARRGCSTSGATVSSDTTKSMGLPHPNAARIAGHERDKSAALRCVGLQAPHKAAQQGVRPGKNHGHGGQSQCIALGCWLLRWQSC